MKTKSPLKPETIALLLKIKKRILDEPRQFGMEWWFMRSLAGTETIPNCGTACIGGWAICVSLGTPAFAKNAAKRIDHFIATGE